MEFKSLSSAVSWCNSFIAIVSPGVKPPTYSLGKYTCQVPSLGPGLQWVKTAKKLSETAKKKLIREQNEPSDGLARGMAGLQSQGSATLSLPAHSAHFAHLFPPLWSWVPGQMDKEKGAIQTLLGKHKKLVLRKKNRHDFDICHLHLIAKTLSLENIEKRQKKRGNWIKLAKNKLGTHTTFADLVWRKNEAENTYNFGTIYHLSTQINLEYYKLQ